MKKLLVLIIVTLISVICFSQDSIIKVPNDFEIANAIILKKGYSLENILDDFNINYWVTETHENMKSVYISYNNSVRLWEFRTGTIYKTVRGVKEATDTNIITEVFVRYRHSNLNDLKDFFSYDKLENTKIIGYEKEHGSKLSHFRVYKK